MLLLTLGLVVIFAALFGWGWLAQRLLGTRLPAEVNPLVGMAACLFVGGLLAALKGADRTGLSVILGTGVLAALVAMAPAKLRAWWQPRRGLELLVVVVATGFLAALAAAPTALSPYDDFEKYALYPLRLLSRGTLYAGPFDALGAEAMVGLSLLQGMALLFGPLTAAHAIDAVVAVAAGLLAFMGLARRLERSTVAVLAAMVLFLVIDPLALNLSALYSGAALLLLVLTWPLLVPPAERRGAALLSWRQSALAGLLYAGLATLKGTFALLIPMHYAVFALALLATPEFRRSGPLVWVRLLRIPLLATAFLFPWILLHLPNLLLMLTPPPPGPDYPPANLLWDPFATAALPFGFGSAPRDFTLLALLMTIPTLALVWWPGERPLLARTVVTSAALTLAGGTALLVILAVTYLYPLQHALRYAAAMLLAAPVLLVVATPRRLLPTVVTAAAALAVVALFGESAHARYTRLVADGHMLGLPQLVADGAVEMTRRQTSDSLGAVVHEAEQLLPTEGRTLVWTGLALHLDFGARVLWTVNTAGLSAPWQRFPFAGTMAQQAAYLRALGVTAMLIQEGSLHVREADELATLQAADRPPMAQRSDHRSYAFATFLQALTATSGEATLAYDAYGLKVILLRPAP